jgi:transglutaminase-like putative cysteine protease/tetratricopeptide (TPR) repeat protein
MKLPSRAAIHLFLRHTIYLLLLLPIQRYLAALMPLWPVVLLYVPARLVLAGVDRRRRSGRDGLRLGRAIIPTGLLLGCSSVLFGTFWAVAGVTGAGGWWEERLLFAGTELLPATLLALTFLLGEIAYGWGRRGGGVFVAVVTGAVVAIFWSQADFRTELFGHPSWYAVYAGLLVVAVVAHQVTAPVFGIEPASVTDGAGGGPLRTRTTRAIIGRVLSALIILLVLLSALGFVYRGWQNRAVAAGGGLLQPTLFRFDFSDYITLEPEIRLSRDLVFLYREDHAPPDRLLRRYVLSGYDPRRGFYRLDAADEPAGAPPLSVREAAEGAAPAADSGEGVEVAQEYYLINLDPEALIAVNEPTAVRPIPSDARSSFNSAYRVLSRRPDDNVLAMLAAGWPEELPESWREVYLSGPISPRVTELAEEITADAESYFETVLAVVTHLHDEYFYSLAPGESRGGDQIEHFLFDSRKGYCSYFAFSMTLMLRSLGVPSRVAVGFFIDPASSMLGFHPVRGDMAHAWVEVWFDGIGWVEFDPTSTAIAPGEVIASDYEMDQERLSSLVQEILAGIGDDTGDSPEEVIPRERGGLPVGRAVGIPAGVFVLLLAAAGWYLRRRRRWFRLRKANPRRGLLLLALRARHLVSPDSDEVASVIDRARFSRAVALIELDEFEATYGEIVSRAIDSPGSALRRWWYLRIPPAVGRMAASGPMEPPDRTNGHDRMKPPHGMSDPDGTRHETPPGAGRGSSDGTGLERRGAEPARRDGRILILVFLLIAAVPPRAETQVPPDVTVDGGRSLGSGDSSVVDTAASADQALEAARAAMDSENYERSLRLLREGRRAHPGDYRFPLVRGDLYFGESLFELAVVAYEDALAVGAPRYSTSYMISRALSRLNRNAEATRILEMLYRQDTEDLSVIGDLGWLYFKTHRLEDARELLERGIAELGSDRDLMMTLATVYSGLWNYDAARRQYERAIEDGLIADDRVFLAVAYYNLSILNANFYRYDEALAAAERSLETRERASGYMIRAELREMQLSDAAAAADYSRAAVLDQVTPLAHLSLAALWIRQGYPDRALARLDRVTGEDAGNWIYNYGTDPDRYQRQVYGLYADAWRAEAYLTRLQRPGTIIERTVRLGRSVQARVRSWYYRGLERRYRRRIADAYAAEGRALLAGWNRMVTAEPWPRVAVRYAAEAAAIETAFNPEAALDYRLFVAGMSADRAELEALSSEMRGPWRSRDRAGALRELYRHAPGVTAGRDAALRAWAAEPGAFLVSGLRVPVELEILTETDAGNGSNNGASTSGAGLSSRRQRRVLRRMGFRLDAESPLHLELRWRTGAITYRVIDGRSGAQLRSGRVRHGGDPVGALEAVAMELTRGQPPDDGGAPLP